MIPLSEITFDYTRGQGPGGQHKNKTESCVVATHIPTGLSVRIDGRCQHKNKREAVRKLNHLVECDRRADMAKRKKAHRDEKVRNHQRHVRTYDFKRRVVKDHRTGRTADLRKVLEGGHIELLFEDSNDE